jgi:nucleoside 2-deoxyribosyltransferase
MELMREQMPDFEAIPYSIRIGVTGHRKLEDPTAVETLVKRAIDAEVEGLFPGDSRRKIERVRRAGTAAISFRILSPLAEGADRVVARAVLSYPDARLVAVLPMTLEDYLEDFATEKSRKEFEELLALCRKPVFLRTWCIRDECGEQDKLRAELRRDAYTQAGRYVVDHCDVLIAVWDGEPSRDRGGTAEIVQYALEKNRPIMRVWEDSFEVLNRSHSTGE